MARGSQKQFERLNKGGSISLMMGRHQRPVCSERHWYYRVKDRPEKGLVETIWREPGERGVSKDPPDATFSSSSTRAASPFFMPARSLPHTYILVETTFIGFSIDQGGKESGRRRGKKGLLWIGFIFGLFRRLAQEMGIFPLSFDLFRYVAGYIPSLEGFPIRVSSFPRG